MQAKAQDRYVPSANTQLFNPEANFTSAELAYGNPAVSKATLARLKQLAELNEQADYTGMSSDEIYAEIWNRYDEAFDGNMVAITARITGPVEWDRINNQFVGEIYQHIVRPEEKAARITAGVAQASTYEEKRALEKSCYEEACCVSRDARWKALGYEGMSFEEREAAIKEKYAGKNTTLDFLKMQSELERSGVLEHKMGDQARIYCDLIQTQFEYAFNPDYTKKGSSIGVNLHISTDQWNRVADQPFGAAKLAVGMKEQLGRIRSANGCTDDTVKMIEDCIDQFVKGVIGDGIDQLIGAAEK